MEIKAFESHQLKAGREEQPRQGSRGFPPSQIRVIHLLYQAQVDEAQYQQKLAEQMPCRQYRPEEAPNAWDEDQPPSSQERGFFVEGG